MPLPNTPAKLSSEWWKRSALVEGSDEKTEKTAPIRPIRIVLAEDHTLFREGLKSLLAREQDFLVTAEAARADEVGPAVADGDAEVLLLDLKMPGGEAVRTLLRLRREHPDVRTLVLTAYEDADSIMNTAKAGARGYLLKDADPETLFQAVRTVSRGGVWIDPGLPRADEFVAIAARADHDTPTHAVDALKSLTRREMEVLRLVAEGLSNEEIAALTFISERTVKAHVNNIFTKLKVNNRVKAALALIRGGIPATAPPAPRPPNRSKRAP